MSSITAPKHLSHVLIWKSCRIPQPECLRTIVRRVSERAPSCILSSTSRRKNLTEEMYFLPDLCSDNISRPQRRLFSSSHTSEKEATAPPRSDKIVQPKSDPMAKKPNKVCDPYGQSGKPLDYHQAKSLLSTLDKGWIINNQHA